MSQYDTEYRVNSVLYSTQHTRHKPPRRVLFLCVFFALLTFSEVYIFLQPKIYRSEATLSVTAKINQQSPALSITDGHNLSVQQNVLLGQHVLSQIVERLNMTFPITVNELRHSLSVERVADSQLLKLYAEGVEPAQLQRIINNWIAVYQVNNAVQVVEDFANTETRLKSELQHIDHQVDEKRQQIDEFRSLHDISSLESTENQAHARLLGLNESLKKALDDEVTAKANRDAVQHDIAEGKNVVPDTDTLALAALTDQAEKLREKYSDLRGQYTEQYIQLNPALRAIPEQLHELDNKIANLNQAGKNVLIQQIENSYSAAKQAVKDLQIQLADHKKVISEFALQFEKHQAMQTELKTLETLQQQTKQQILDIDVKKEQNLPQVTVIDYASLPDKPIRPQYIQEAALAFIFCLIIALLSLRIVEYLNTEKPSYPQEALPSNYFYNIDNLKLTNKDSLDPITLSSVKAISQQFPNRELSQKEIQAMFDAAEPINKIILLLLLNGLNCNEILSLTKSSLDVEQAELYIPLTNRRLSMTKMCQAYLKENPWHQFEYTEDEINAIINYVAVDAGISAPEEINSEMINFAYSLFLVRQGIKLSELSKIFGALNPKKLALLGKYSPEFSGKTIVNIDLEFLKET